MSHARCRSAVRRRWCVVAWALVAVAAPAVAQQVRKEQPPTTPPVVTVTGTGPSTFVLLSGIVGGVAGFQRLQAELAAQGRRVIVVDPYALSIDSTDVTFAALARRVNAVLVGLHVDSASVVGHAHGAGVALRLAASAPERVGALYLLDVGALPSNRTKVFSGALRLVPLITRLPGGRRFVQSRFIKGMRQNAGRQEWLDPATQRAYTEPMLDRIDRVVDMALRLADAREPQPVDAVVAQLQQHRVPVLVLLGDVPHPAQPDSIEIAALARLGPMLRVERLRGVGHFPHEEAPAEVARYLLARRTGAVSDAR